MGMIELIPVVENEPIVKLTQWDLNRQVRIKTEEPITEVHFAQTGDVEALVVDAFDVPPDLEYHQT